MSGVTPETALAPEAVGTFDGGPRAPRRGLRAAIRWTAAVLVFAAFGGATAYAVTQPERTRIPGLRTPDDGRWTYPPIALPKLPPGKARPFADVNKGQRHYVDLRSLLLPAPEGAAADRAVPGPAGWLPTAALLKAYRFDDAARRTGELTELREQGLRHVAARSWTSPDGTRTDLYLTQFLSAAYADVESPGLSAQPLNGVKDPVKDPGVESAAVPSAVTVDAWAAPAGHGAAATRYAYLYAGDVVALVVQTRRGSVAEVPFRQTVRLQAQLLG